MYKSLLTWNTFSRSTNPIRRAEPKLKVSKISNTDSFPCITDTVSNLRAAAERMSGLLLDSELFTVYMCSWRSVVTSLPPNEE